MVIQTNFRNCNVSYKYSVLMIKWIVQELALFIENL